MRDKRRLVPNGQRADLALYRRVGSRFETDY
jgi:hypothetical protein